jgi:hypothetical protein
MNHKERVLILTPVKDASSFLEGYFKALSGLEYPHELLSIGILESDSGDNTFEELQARLPEIKARYRNAGLWKKDFGYHIPHGVPRWANEVQVERRVALAKSRNHLLFRALTDEDWVLWLDVDVIEYPADVIERLLATGKDIVHPNCVYEYGGPSFDLNAWRDHGLLHMHDLRGEGDLVKLDAVGGTMLFVKADVHRDGLIFPPFCYGLENPLRRVNNFGEIETEGLGLMAKDMGYQCWGMPHLEIKHWR